MVAVINCVWRQTVVECANVRLDITQMTTLVVNQVRPGVYCIHIHASV